jgi:hypothetical protein
MPGPTLDPAALFGGILPANSNGRACGKNNILPPFYDADSTIDTIL